MIMRQPLRKGRELWKRIGKRGKGGKRRNAMMLRTGASLPKLNS